MDPNLPYVDVRMAERITGRYPHLAGILPAKSNPRFMRHFIPGIIRLGVWSLGMGITGIYGPFAGSLTTIILSVIVEILFLISALFGLITGANWFASMLHIRVISWETGKANPLLYCWRAVLLSFAVGTWYVTGLFLAVLTEFAGFPSHISFISNFFFTNLFNPSELGTILATSPDDLSMLTTSILLFIFCFTSSIGLVMYYMKRDRYGRTILDRITNTGIIGLGRSRDSHLEGYEDYLDMEGEQVPPAPMYVTPVRMGSDYYDQNSYAGSYVHDSYDPYADQGYAEAGYGNANYADGTHAGYGNPEAGYTNSNYANAGNAEAGYTNNNYANPGNAGSQYDPQGYGVPPAAGYNAPGYGIQPPPNPSTNPYAPEYAQSGMQASPQAIPYGQSQPIMPTKRQVGEPIQPLHATTQRRIIPQEEHLEGDWHVSFGDQTSIPINHALIIGRNPSDLALFPDADKLKLNDASQTISKTHVALENTGSELVIHDLESKNGTSVIYPDGRKEPVKGMLTVLGTTPFTLKIGDIYGEVSP